MWKYCVIRGYVSTSWLGGMFYMAQMKDTETTLPSLRVSHTHKGRTIMDELLQACYKATTLRLLNEFSLVKYLF